LESPKKVFSRRALVRGLALAAVAQGIFTIQPAMAEQGVVAVQPQPQVPAELPADPGSASIIGVL
jgi:hypothetical protein